MNPEFLSPDIEPQVVEVKEEEKKEKPIDALVVFGGGILSDQSLEAMAMGQKLQGYPEKGWRLPIGARLRVLGAVELFAGGEVNDVILTGGPVAKGAGIEASEAKLMKKYFLHEIKKKWQKELKDQNKTEDEAQAELAERLQNAELHVLLEDKATNTIENFAYTINYLEDNKYKYHNIGLLSNDFHINRIVQLAGKMDVEGKGFGADTVLQEAEIDPRLQAIDRKYFGRENNSYREQVLDGLDEESRRIAESRLGGSLADAEKGERRWSRGLSRIPEYWVPNVKYIKDFDKLKRILMAEESVQKVLQEKGIEDINMATEEELRTVLDQMERKMPPEEWGENQSKIKISLVRHGQSLHNVAEIPYFAGGSKEFDLGLTQEGIESAHELTQEMKKGERVDVIVHSDMLRSRQTAKIIAADLGYPVELVEIAGFREINVGSFAGKTRQEIIENGTDEERKSLKEFIGRDISKINFPQGENFQTASERISQALQQLIHEYGDKTRFVIVGHGNSNKIALSLMFPDNIGFASEINISHQAIVELDVRIDNHNRLDFDNVHIINPGEDKGLI